MGDAAMLLEPTNLCIASVVSWKNVYPFCISLFGFLMPVAGVLFIKSKHLTVVYNNMLCLTFVIIGF